MDNQIIQNPVTGYLNFISYAALAILKEILAESARSGKSVEELLDAAMIQTNTNADQAAALLARLKGE
jgi:hypothetical protein